MESTIVPFIISIAIFFALFLLFREVYCWCLKINQRVAQLDEIKRLLEKISEQLDKK